MRQIILIAHNLRSCHNVGSLLRTADGLGITKVILSGYTPYPLTTGDVRLPHEARKIHSQISKTALGAEDSVTWTHETSITDTINTLQCHGYDVFAVEQSANSIKLPDFIVPNQVALILGREVEGIEPEVINASNG